MKSIYPAIARWMVTVTIVMIAVLVGMSLWRRFENAPWTRDGHVYADVVQVAPDVQGLVTQVPIVDNQIVHKGQLLFVVDRPRYLNALAMVDADIASARAVLEQARRVVHRDRALGDLVSTESGEEDASKVQTAEAALEQTIAARSTAKLNLDRTSIYAPVDGYITNLSLRPGDYLAAGKQALAMIDTDSIRVEAYLEETKLKPVRIGDHARIRLMGDDSDLMGHVQSIAGGIADDQNKAGQNLLATVNPTFSWVRLAQRIPVRIHIDRVPPGTRLISGRTATVTILSSRA